MCPSMPMCSLCFYCAYVVSLPPPRGQAQSQPANRQANLQSKICNPQYPAFDVFVKNSCINNFFILTVVITFVAVTHFSH